MKAFESLFREMRKFYYNQGIARNHQKEMYQYGSPYSRWWQNKRNFYVKKLLSECKNRTFLDVGCAEGLHTRLNALKWKGYSIGIDVSRPKLLRAKIYSKQLSKNVTLCDYVVADAEHLPFVDEVFDLSLSNDVLRYLIHPIKAIDEIIRVSQTAIISSGTHYLSSKFGKNFWILFRHISWNFIKIFSANLLPKDEEEVKYDFSRHPFGGDLWCITPRWLVEKCKRKAAVKQIFGHYQQLISLISFFLKPVRDSHFYLKCINILDIALAQKYPFNYFGRYTTVKIARKRNTESSIMHILSHESD